MYDVRKPSRFNRYYVADVCGCLYVNTPTLIGDVVQAIQWADNWIYDEELDYASSQAKSMVGREVRKWEQWLGPQPAIARLTHTGNETKGRYSSHITSTSPESLTERARLWGIKFDLLLHDAAVTYMNMAVWERDVRRAKRLMDVSYDFWFYSRNLRTERERQIANDYSKQLYALRKKLADMGVEVPA